MRGNVWASLLPLVLCHFPPWSRLLSSANVRYKACLTFSLHHPPHCCAGGCGRGGGGRGSGVGAAAPGWATPGLLDAGVPGLQGAAHHHHCGRQCAQGELWCLEQAKVVRLRGR